MKLPFSPIRCKGKATRSLFIISGLVLAVILFYSGRPSEVSSKTTLGSYIVLAWNDLGMHCANKTFEKIAVLPPYNNLKAQLIQRGSAGNLPVVLTGNYSLSYSIPGNTYSVGKTNFWTYEQQLFGVNLPDNIGLTGKGLSGVFDTTGNSFQAEGIPITPYTDANLLTESPYQLALVSAFNSQGVLLATTQPVIPVSNEINCVSSGCHSSENQILNEHEIEGGFNPNNTPILCASCHSSNALGTSGSPGLESFSEVIHAKHAGETNNCYKCHPGPNTSCFRDVMYSAGMTCQSCHGSLAQVAQSIANGREPWLEEPSCGATTCHGSGYAEEPGKLFRNSRGHGNLFCSACHGSPHAIQPTVQQNDNVQNTSLQGFAGTLAQCSVCHGITPQGAGPHGILVTEIEPIPGANTPKTKLLNLFPNPVTPNSSIDFSVTGNGKTRISLFDVTGKRTFTLANRSFNPGQYRLPLPFEQLSDGVWIIQIEEGIRKDALQFIK